MGTGAACDAWSSRRLPLQGILCPWGKSQWGVGLTKPRARSWSTGVFARPVWSPSCSRSQRKMKTSLGWLEGTCGPNTEQSQGSVCAWGEGGEVGRRGSGRQSRGWLPPPRAEAPGMFSGALQLSPPPEVSRICSTRRKLPTFSTKEKISVFTLTSHRFQDLWEVSLSLPFQLF